MVNSIQGRILQASPTVVPYMRFVNQRGLNVTLKQLEVFVAVAEYLSFSKGAEKACITQSTASQHIHALEDELEIRLFDRSRSGVFLTEAGTLFLEHSLKIIKECSNSLSAIRRFRGMENVVLKVGASSIPGTCLIPAMLGDYLKVCPKVCLDVIQGDSTSIQQQLLNGQIELGLVGGHVDDERLQSVPIGQDNIICVAPPTIMEKIGNNLTPVELCQIPLVAREDGSGTQQAVHKALFSAGVKKEKLRTTAVLGSSEAVRRAVMNGTGCAFMSNLAVAKDLEDGTLAVLTILGLEISRNFYAVKRSGRELSPAAAAFWLLMTQDVYNS